jgi:hypothetical protein
VIFSKLELNDAELNFKNKVAGLHTFCLKLSSRSRTVAHRVLPSRAKKQPRMVAVDVQADKTLHHDRAREGDVAFIMEKVSDVQREVQVLFCGCLVVLTLLKGLRKPTSPSWQTWK